MTDEHAAEPSVIIMMGVSGVGKTTVGVALAKRLGWPFLEADDDHPPANVAKMARGEALTDADRDGWIEALCARIERHAAQDESVVVACSALRRKHRARLRSISADVTIVFLEAKPELIEERLRERVGHFAGPELLPSQLAQLQQPRTAVVMDASQPVDEIVDSIFEELNL